MTRKRPSQFFPAFCILLSAALYLPELMFSNSLKCYSRHNCSCELLEYQRGALEIWNDVELLRRRLQVEQLHAHVRLRAPFAAAGRGAGVP